MKFLCKALALTIALIVKAKICEGELKCMTHSVHELVLILAELHAINSYSTVGVSPPWERITYMPQNSTIQINCTANSIAHSPVWSILLSGTTAMSQFSFQASIRLLNSWTDGNNGTLSVMMLSHLPCFQKQISLFLVRTIIFMLHSCRCWVHLSLQNPLLCLWMQLTFTCKLLISHGALWASLSTPWPL